MSCALHIASGLLPVFSQSSAGCLGTEEGLAVGLERLELFSGLHRPEYQRSAVFSTAELANSKQIWGNRGQVLMLSDRLRARVAEGVMGDEWARRGFCPWRLRQLGLGAGPCWWARSHSHCQRDGVGPVSPPHRPRPALSSSVPHKSLVR
ncbi:hypothetical protein EYF80_012830 [Liparis tanakae]|uniref:Uncharacterized protein n=1 Tax=Liparis tanakae TaxID=230148 RepID=A0A4Z2IHQ6_9TELE|nr:hypothetical protein EYF80_012830 [Liparis tanakae]